MHSPGSGKQPDTAEARFVSGELLPRLAQWHDDCLLSHEEVDDLIFPTAHAVGPDEDTGKFRERAMIVLPQPLTPEQRSAVLKAIAAQDPRCHGMVFCAEARRRSVGDLSPQEATGLIASAYSVDDFPEDTEEDIIIYVYQSATLTVSATRVQTFADPKRETAPFREFGQLCEWHYHQP
jgi:hypothetical protein